jgi:23S rRNA (cytosine1962-C5)-methyltransferase
MEQTLAKVCLKKGREKPVNNHHPWIFSGAISNIITGNPEPGEFVDILGADGTWLAKAYFNPLSQIQARILSWDPGQEIDEGFWREKLEQAIGLRELLHLEPATTAYRLVNAEADGIPGLVVDKYNNFLVFQALTAGIDRRKEMLISILAELLSPDGIIERSDVNVRKKEGLTKVTAQRFGSTPPEKLTVLENGYSFIADLYQGHKTGLYLDQRANRATVCRSENVAGREVLNVFAYTGGFAINAAAGGASRITNIDTSAIMLEGARQNMKLNGWERPDDEYIKGDAFQKLRKLRDDGRQFDVAIVDPPKFAQAKRDVPAACRGYKDINLLAMQLLRKNGLLATFSCSGLIDGGLFQKVLFGASIDAGRDVQIIQLLAQAADHPILLTFPESFYLKGFICRVH